MNMLFHLRTKFNYKETGKCNLRSIAYYSASMRGNFSSVNSTEICGYIQFSCYVFLHAK